MTRYRRWPSMAAWRRRDDRLYRAQSGLEPWMIGGRIWQNKSELDAYVRAMNEAYKQDITFGGRP